MHTKEEIVAFLSSYGGRKRGSFIKLEEDTVVTYLSIYMKFNRSLKYRNAAIESFLKFDNFLAKLHWFYYFYQYYLIVTGTFFYLD